MKTDRLRNAVLEQLNNTKITILWDITLCSVIEIY
jgi:hypothetical protein